MSEGVGALRIERLEVGGFRPFAKPVVFEDLKRVNLIVGPNNVGKSAALMPLRRMTRLDPGLASPISAEDSNRAAGSPHSLRFNEDDFRDDVARIDLNVKVSGGRLPQYLASALGRPHLLKPLVGQGEFPDWYHLHMNASPGGGPGISVMPETIHAVAAVFAKYRGEQASLGIDLGPLAIEIARVLAAQIVNVPSLRTLSESPIARDPQATDERRYDGESLWADLLRWQLPDAATGATGSHERLRELEAFLSSVLDASTKVWATLDEGIRVAIGGDRGRDLRSLGWGVGQVAIIGAAIAHRGPGAILLLEEPEIGIHPRLQRSLLRALAKQDIQAFITTHSNHLIDVHPEDTKELALYHLTQAAGGQRTVSRFDRQHLDMLHELGVTASSIAAANAVLWVEGPSDAIYLRAWLEHDPAGRELVEGRDFTFAFHAGALLDHFSIDSDESLVRFLHMHAAFYVIADSDRRQATAAPSHPYLTRLLADSRLKGRIWVTEPKEIEGYVPDRVFAPGSTADPPVAAPYARLKHRLAQLGLAPSLAKRKVELARDAVKRFDGTCPSDLRSRLDELVAFIEKCRAALPRIAGVGGP